MSALLAVMCLVLVFVIFEGIYALERQRSSNLRNKVFQAMRVNRALRRGLS